jgi:hypothetical protein
LIGVGTRYEEASSPAPHHDPARLVIIAFGWGLMGICHHCVYVTARRDNVNRFEEPWQLREIVLDGLKTRKPGAP